MKFIHETCIAAAAMLTLSACASSEVKSISQSSVAPSSIRVGSITISNETANQNAALVATLKQEITTATGTCATGSILHNLHVTITEYEGQNVAKTILIGDDIELGGRVTLTNNASGQSAGVFFVKREFSWGGIAGAAMMANAERSLSKSFARSICQKIFGYNG